MTIYLDHNATTPVDKRVADEIMHHFLEEYGNAGSRTHEHGQNAARVVNQARATIAATLDARDDEVIFTSGATEADNIALLGLGPEGQRTGRRHIVSTAIEHKAVLEPLQRLADSGFEVELIRLGVSGRVAAEDVLAAVRADTLLVSVMAANNETGVIQPLEQISEGLGGHDAYLHVDAAQTYGKKNEPLRDHRVDLISLSAHKVFGPKGVGALIARRRGYRRPPLTPLTVGGGQERGLRPGTLPVPLIAGFALAAELADKEHPERLAACQAYRDEVLAGLAPLSPLVHGDQDYCLPHVLNISLPGLDSEAVMVAWRGLIEVSNGSACTSASYEPSHVLAAMDVPEEQILGALRLSWSHLTPPADWADAVARVRALV
ncbi:aminotransferase class V-fold PLP-dependent enzyme [Actinocrinis puniceicyclus]|uniref:cysteine desulfurase n=1 Tax=Actinocrinis puniceicyclus TaxID=977794 RepID=A0A8J7WQG0_9ACTN|nr:aminotransferase class V-fold PLP-dependent enzyme [Actinocrinis puniceicyclus]MBS2965628.1 aminotransferase class V-fold PLP-dependent enzyme [Actinocrinis puniceicyclus]